MKTLAFAALLLAGLFQQIPQSQTGAIEGTIVQTGTTTPIPSVQVRIEGRGRPPFTAATTSDERGYFLLPNIPTGIYTLTAQREGFLGRVVNASTLLLASMPITAFELNSGQTFRVATLSLTPAGSIHGRILDSDAQPLAGLAVDVARTTRDEKGRKSLQRAAAVVRTDERGEYRMSMLAPGEYYVRAYRTSSVFGIGELVVPIYFPGTVEPLTAATVTVSAGGEVTADFHTLPVSKYSISGAVVDSLPDVHPFPQLSFQLLPRNRMNIDNVAATVLLVPEGSSGSFEIRGVPAGLFDLHVQANTSGKTYSASAEIEVRDKDLKDLSLTLKPGRDVKGRLTVVGDTPRNLRLISSLTDPNSIADRMGEIRLFLGRTIPFTGTSGGQMVVDDEGKRFTFENVPDGSYTLSAAGLALGADNNYLLDLRVGGRSVPNQEILVGSDAVDSIEVVIGTDGASIQGTVEGTTRDGGQVILVPDQTRWQNASLFKRVNLFDGFGTFTLRGIAPGDYRLLAFSGTERVPFRSEEFLSQYGPRMKTITVQKRAVLTGIQIPLIRVAN